MECCNTPHVTCHICNSDSCHFRLCDMFFPPLSGFVFRFVFCHVMHFHIMSSCALHSHTCSSHAFELFPLCPFCIPALRSPPVVISTFLSCVRIKHFRIGPRLAKRPWFTTGRPPVKFRTTWTSFDAPTVNRGTEKASCVLQPNTPKFGPQPTKL